MCNNSSGTINTLSAIRNSSASNRARGNSIAHNTGIPTTAPVLRTESWIPHLRPALPGCRGLTLASSMKAIGSVR
jgi:hypothetical protein